MDGRRARIVLGVGNDAGPAEIRRAFRARALVTHPDHGGDRFAFAELTDALAVLDPIVRRSRPAPVRPVARESRWRRAARASTPTTPPADPPLRRDFADVLHAATARLG